MSLVESRIVPTRLSCRSESSSRQAISYLMGQWLENPDCLSLAAGFVDQSSLPVQLTRQAVGKLLTDEEFGKATLQYGSTVGIG